MLIEKNFGIILNDNYTNNRQQKNLCLFYINIPYNFLTEENWKKTNKQILQHSKLWDCNRRIGSKN